MTDTLHAPAEARRAPPPAVMSDLPEPLQQLVAQWRAALAEDFKGVTTDGKVRPGLFPLRSSGVSTQPIVTAAKAFLAALDRGRRQAAMFAVDDRRWRAWSNIHRNIMRHGFCLEELTDAERVSALALVRASVSAEAYQTVLDAMKLNAHLRELTGLPDEYGEWFCWLSIFGKPSETEPWGWQLDGHHININCFVLGDQMVLTPCLLGAEPVRAESGKYAGTTVLRREEAAGWTLMNALDPAQQERARLGLDLPFDGYASGFKDNLEVPYQGVRFGGLTDSQQTLLLGLLDLYIGRLPPAAADVKREEVRAHLEETHFAWIGLCDATSPFYYRVHSPVIYVEFYHQPGVALPNAGYSRRHAHALVRTPNGNDYGRELLRQYREQRSPSLR